MIQRLLAIAVLLLGGATGVCAESETRPATQPDSPKQALKAQDAAARAGNVDADLSFYRAEDDQQKKLARAIAIGDIAVARLEAAVDRKFGKDSASTVIRAAGSESAAALEAATEKLDGDHATVQFSDTGSSVPMVRAGGKWKISLGDWVKDAKPERIDQLIAAVEKLAADLDHVTGLVEKDRFRSGEGVRDRVQRLHDQLLGPAH
jgi:hypothetical protein